MCLGRTKCWQNISEFPQRAISAGTSSERERKKVRLACRQWLEYGAGRGGEGASACEDIQECSIHIAAWHAPAHDQDVGAPVLAHTCTQVHWSSHQTQASGKIGEPDVSHVSDSKDSVCEPFNPHPQVPILPLTNARCPLVFATNPLVDCARHPSGKSWKPSRHSLPGVHAVRRKREVKSK